MQQFKASNIQKNFSELLVKFNLCKKELTESKKKIAELEAALVKCDEQNKFTEQKYSELVNSHKKMFGYIENLEVKIRKFQEKRKIKKNTTLDFISRECSLNYTNNYDCKSLSLTISAPITVFSLKLNS